MLNFLCLLWAKFFQRLHGTAVRSSSIDKLAKVCSNCNIINCKMEKCSYIGVNSCVVNTEIGKFCSIADNVYIGGARHPLEWVSTSPAFQNVKRTSSKIKYSQLDWNPFSKKVVIGNDVWIGHGVVIQQGVTIGDGAVIGSNAVVTKDVPPYAIVAGAPAKLIRYRFDGVIINKLEKIKWWNLSDDKLRQLGPYMNDINSFLNFIEKSEI